METEKETLKTLSSLPLELERANTIQKRLQLLVERVGNPNAFARLTELSVSGVKRYLSGGEPTASKIIQIADKLGIEPNWLLTGKGPLSLESEFDTDDGVNWHEIPVTDEEVLETLSESVHTYEFIDKFKKRWGIPSDFEIDEKHFVEIPEEGKAELKEKVKKIRNCTYSGVDSKEYTIKESPADYSFSHDFALIPGYSIQVSAGQGTLNGDQMDPSRYLAFRKKWLKFRGFSEKDLVIVWAKGDSMEPTIHNNDTVVVHTGRTRPQDGHIYIFRNGDELFVKRYQSMLGSWRLISDNPIYAPLDIPKEEQHQFEVVGQVVHVAKDFGE